MHRTSLILPALVLVALAACAAPPTTPAATTASDGSGVETDDPTAVAGGAGPLHADGMPLSGVLQGCDEVVDASVNETDADTQWRWEFVCTSRDAFDASTTALDAVASLERAQEMNLGTDSYISDWLHWIGRHDGRVLDVDAKLTGSPDDLEMVYLVTLRKEA